MTLTEIVASAAIMGGVSSLHCVGMCGPIALALPLSGRPGTERVTGALLYHLGRVTTYSCLGLLFGIAGEMAFPPQWQQTLSILAGSLLLLSVVLPLVVRTSVGRLLRQPMLALRTRLARLLAVERFGALYGIGLLNGLLPCGMVYLALATSFLTGSAGKGGLFMLVFGLGTVPLMFCSVFFATLLRPGIRLRLRKAVPALLIILGALLILRGLNLGIPYVSPGLQPETGGGLICH